MLGEPVGGLQLEPGTAAFLLVGGDPVAAGGADRGEAEQVAGGLAERLAAVLAHVDADRLGVQVAARLAAPRRGGDRAVLAGLGRRQRHGDDLVAGALVVDHRAGAELGDPDEPGPLDVVALAAAVHAGDVGGQRQPRERVAGQEALGGEVPVGVEVRLEVVGVLVGQQVELDAGVVGAPGGVLAFLVRDGGVDGLPGLGIELLAGQPVQVAPAVAGVVEFRGRASDGVFDPAVLPPGDALQVRDERGEQGSRAVRRAGGGARVAELCLDLGEQGQGRGCRRSRRAARVSEPCRSWPVSASQIACTCDLIRSSLARSSRGGATDPPTICSGRRK